MQTAAVLMIVFMAAVYAGWKFLPAHWRAGLARQCAAWLQSSGRISAERARQLENKLASGGACGSCDSCKVCATRPNENRDAALAVIPIEKVVKPVAE